MIGHCACMERKEMHKGFWWGNPNKREHLEDVGTGERSILELILKGNGWEEVDWINLAQEDNK